MIVKIATRIVVLTTIHEMGKQGDESRNDISTSDNGSSDDSENDGDDEEDDHGDRISCHSRLGAMMTTRMS